MAPEGAIFMFTGIIIHLGTFVKRVQNEFVFTVPLEVARRITTSSSIAIDGICLTVKRRQTTAIYVDVMPETIKKTTLESLKPNALVNLELPVTLDTFFAGHIVQGHIDGKGVIKRIISENNSKIVTIGIPGSFYPYIVEKGSVAVNGVSLTIMKISSTSFTVGIIPYTWSHTNFSQIKVGNKVNIEIDILAKYLRKLIKK